MSEVVVTVAIPTLAADAALAECLDSLSRQTVSGFEVVVVDNSGAGRARRYAEGRARTRVLEMKRNVGFGAAINAVWRGCASPYVATLNDDAIACPEWIAALSGALEREPRAGMAASQVLLAADGALDSAGMLIARDGSSKQRGHGRPPDEFDREEETLLPSGSAAMYRRAMLEETGGFDDAFFLYCEDTDLGLRARRLGWTCVYAPAARVEHRYSHSAGRASALKAYYVERNRQAVAIKNLPLDWLILSPVAAVARYAWHGVYLLRGKGTAARFAGGGSGGALKLLWFVVRAHLATLAALPRLLKQRRRIAATARAGAAEYRALLRRHAISVREVASL